MQPCCQATDQGLDTGGLQTERAGGGAVPGLAGMEGTGPQVGPGREPRGPEPPEGHLRDMALVPEAVTGGRCRSDVPLPPTGHEHPA